MEETRIEPRKKKSGPYSLTWKGSDGNTYAAEGAGIDISAGGLGIECPIGCAIGSIVYVQSKDGSVEGDCEVIHSASLGAAFRIGFEFRYQQRTTRTTPGRQDGETDYYEILQINQNADIETIHRVFRIMAARFHPDNSETGDLEMFLRMKTAYSVLSSPTRRPEYDATLDRNRDAGPKRIFGLRDFVVGVDAEFNRRLGVLSLLYNQRRADPDHPGISLLELEKEMGFPREYLAFTIWYLRCKSYVAVADNSDYAITSEGADYVEAKSAGNDIMERLLKPGAPQTPPRPRVVRNPSIFQSNPDHMLALPSSQDQGLN